MAGTRLKPIKSAIKIVDPEREAPGKTAAKSCPKPMAIAIFHVTLSNLERFCTRFQRVQKIRHQPKGPTPQAAHSLAIQNQVYL